MSQQVSQNQEKKQVSFLLGIGVLFFPFIFGWFLFKKGYSPIAKFIGIGWLLFSILILGLRCSVANHMADANAKTSSAATASANDKDVVVVKTSWEYDTTKDKMNRGKEISAWVRSNNEINFKFPYAGPQRATLFLRKNPGGDKDVMVQVEKGQFLCNSYSGCTVNVAFDSQRPTAFSAVGPTDNSTEVIFISNSKKFIEKLKKSKKANVEAVFYQEGNRVLEFDVAGLDWK